MNKQKPLGYWPKVYEEFIRLKKATTNFCGKRKKIYDETLFNLATYNINREYEKSKKQLNLI